MSKTFESREIKGTPYSALFFEDEDQRFAGSFANMIVEPPFIIREDGNLSNEFIRDDCTISHLYSTVNKTVLMLRVKNDGINELGNHEDRIEYAFSAASKLIALLNRVENGTINKSEDFYIVNE